jgi:Cd2+/Zn2+-exporting ATPase
MKAQNIAFRISEMDCGEEIAALKKEIGPIVGGEQFLEFDLLNRKMTVASDRAEINQEEIIRAVNRVGMTATLWTEFCASGTCPVEKSFWQKKGRLSLCLASGIFLLAGFISQATYTGSFLAALMGNQAEGGAAVALYFLAAVAGAWHIVPKAWIAIRKLRPDMNLLMTLAAIGAMILGEWFEAATVAFLFSAALLLESWSVSRARDAIGALMDLSPKKARVIRSGSGDIEEMPVELVEIGSIVAIRPGEKIPLDGVVVKGQSSVNQSPITGESTPASKNVGDEVYAGSINNEGAFEFRVAKPYNDTALARIIHMVEEARSRRAPSEQWVEKFARYYTPAMIGMALFVAVFYPLAFDGEWGSWIYEALVVLVIACPCALVISTPVGIVAGLTTAAREGILIKGGVFLEAAAGIKAVAFDKTGTLTYGRPEVQEVISLSGHTAAETLSRAATLEAMSGHPLAEAILRKAGKNAKKSLTGFRALEGKGAEGLIDGRVFWIGSHRMIHERGGETEELHRAAMELEGRGHSILGVGDEDHICGVISVADEIRATAAKAIAELKRAGIRHIVMLTGDNLGAAKAVASKIGIDEYQAELLPVEKVKTIENLRLKYGSVAMVGDGVNDAPALAASSLGVAMGAIGSDAAIETADIALMSDDLLKLPWLISHARRATQIIKQNIAFALGLKALFLGLAFAGFATLWMAIMADMGASFLVISNSLRLLNSSSIKS